MELIDLPDDVLDTILHMVEDHCDTIKSDMYFKIYKIVKQASFKKYNPVDGELLVLRKRELLAALLKQTACPSPI